MARSPLFSLLARSLRSATLAYRHQIPVDEWLEQSQKSKGWTRRSFLKMAGGLSGGMLLAAGCDRSSSSASIVQETSVKIAIIGAGIAGLNI